MPSKIQYKKPKLKAPPELIAWFDEVKNDKSSKTMAKMKSIRGQFKMIKGNTDPDHSLFRAKLSGRASVNYEEVVYAVKVSGVSRADGRPVVSNIGYARQMDLLEII